MSDPITITPDQLTRLRELADELDRLALATLLHTPPAFHIKQLQRALPEVALKIKAWIAAAQGDDETSEARF